MFHNYNKVEKEFIKKGKVVLRGNILLFSKKEGLRFINKCKRCGIKILGVDGFYLGTDYTKPSMSNSVDFSLNSYKNNGVIYQEAKNFIKNRDNDLYFEIVCES